MEVKKVIIAACPFMAQDCFKQTVIGEDSKVRYFALVDHDGDDHYAYCSIVRQLYDEEGPEILIIDADESILNYLSKEGIPFFITIPAHVSNISNVLIGVDIDSKELPRRDYDKKYYKEMKEFCDDGDDAPRAKYFADKYNKYDMPIIKCKSNVVFLIAAILNGKFKTIDEMKQELINAERGYIQDAEF